MSSITTALVPALIAPLQIIVDLLRPVLLFFHDTVGVGWGMSIVLLTVAVRALLSPLMVKQFKSMQSMVRVAPELKALQAKYKDDKQRQQQEVMKFYSENKINPFASCLPLVAQMPFFIGLFYVLQDDLREDICGQTAKVCGEVASSNGAERFLFIPDLTDKAGGWVLAVLIVLYISSQLLSSLLTPSTADRNQQMIMYGLPFVFVFFIINFPSGLIVYWITTNLWTVGQGYILRKRMGPMTMPKDEPALAGVPGGGSAASEGGLMARLSAAAGMAKPDDKPDGKAAGKQSANGASADAKSKSSGAKSSGAKQQGSPKAGAKAGAKSAAGGGGRSRGSSKAKSAGGQAPKPARSGPPPPSPRKKKKRSGRRR
ncbi:MAG: YidC/Oxa1 family membrane protein insertase [Solirubrobacteraceae bacterium]